MQATQLITVMASERNFSPLAGTGKNTIRKFAGKYIGLQLGDNIIMHHTMDPKSQDVTQPLTEILRVSSYAIGTLDNIIYAHGGCSHSMSNLDFDNLKEHILSFYPLAEGEERNESQLYIAIYF
jgi:hypothetical protein